MDRSSEAWGGFNPPDRYLSSFRSRSHLSHLILQNQVLSLEGAGELSLLDVGCGSGNLYRGRSRAFNKKFSRLVAIDLSRPLLLQALRVMPNLEIIEGDASQICRTFKASDTRFTGVSMSHVFEMLEDPIEFLSSISKVTDQIIIEFFLNPNINFSGTVKGYERFPESLGGQEYFRAHYSREEYGEMLSRSGWRIEREYSVVSNWAVHHLKAN
jgi:SAM-dependent methyltransferase